MYNRWLVASERRWECRSAALKHSTRNDNEIWDSILLHRHTHCAFFHHSISQKYFILWRCGAWRSIGSIWSLRVIMKSKPGNTWKWGNASDVPKWLGPEYNLLGLANKNTSLQASQLVWRTRKHQLYSAHTGCLLAFLWRTFGHSMSRNQWGIVSMSLPTGLANWEKRKVGLWLLHQNDTRSVFVTQVRFMCFYARPASEMLLKPAAMGPMQFKIFTRMAAITSVLRIRARWNNRGYSEWQAQADSPSSTDLIDWRLSPSLQHFVDAFTHKDSNM